MEAKFYAGFISSISAHAVAASYHFEDILEMVGFCCPLVKPSCLVPLC
ncbi:hypothetical protein [Daejeonella sp.]|nr:hypothetical protein [Daejeonella sp.]MDO8993119.1 hypothetical protein [Daejeonella sp.]MDP2415317.1 hypothetical protein [Daejeonella sp.]